MMSLMSTKRITFIIEYIRQDLGCIGTLNLKFKVQSVFYCDTSTKKKKKCKQR